MRQHVVATWVWVITGVLFLMAAIILSIMGTFEATLFWIGVAFLGAGVGTYLRQLL